MIKLRMKIRIINKLEWDGYIIFIFVYGCYSRNLLFKRIYYAIIYKLFSDGENFHNSYYLNITHGRFKKSYSINDKF